MKQLLALICGATLIVAYAQAQTRNPSSTTSSNPATNPAINPATTSMTSGTSNTIGSTTDSSGTVTEYTPGAAITLDHGTGNPTRFILGHKVQVLGPDGKTMANTDVKKNAKVHLRFGQEGDRTVVEQINVEELK